MKWTHNIQQERNNNSGARRPGAHSAGSIRGAIAHVKQIVLNEYAPRAGEHLRLLRLALNEAEALAWQTQHPHLIFPLLAAEKAQNAISWHERQRTLLHNSSELSFAE